MDLVDGEPRHLDRGIPAGPRATRCARRCAWRRSSSATACRSTRSGSAPRSSSNTSTTSPTAASRAVGLEPLNPGVENPFPWLAEMMDIKKEQNFFEGRVTEYQKASALETRQTTTNCKATGAPPDGCALQPATRRLRQLADFQYPYNWETHTTNKLAGSETSGHWLRQPKTTTPLRRPSHHQPMIGRPHSRRRSSQLKRFATTPSDQKPRFNWRRLRASQAEANTAAAISKSS